MGGERERETEGPERKEMASEREERIEGREMRYGHQREKSNPGERDET